MTKKVFAISVLFFLILYHQAEAQETQSNLTLKKRPAALLYPSKAFSDGTHLFLIDTFNNRVLIYNKSEVGSEALPDVILGQKDNSSNAPNYGGLSASTLFLPQSAFSDGKSLFIADTGNSRILIYNSIPTKNYEAADVVLGQPDFVSSTSNNGGISDKTLYYPHDVWTDGKLFVVSDTYNNRVLFYAPIPKRNYTKADALLGQSDFTSNSANSGGVSAPSLYFPTGLFYAEGYFFVADQLNHRVKLYKGIPQGNNVPCDIVIGQKDATGNQPNMGGLMPSEASLNSPTGIYYEDGSLYISDFGNNRVLVYGGIPGSNGASSQSSLKAQDLIER